MNSARCYFSSIALWLAYYLLQNLPPKLGKAFGEAFDYECGDVFD